MPSGSEKGFELFPFPKTLLKVKSRAFILFPVPDKMKNRREPEKSLFVNS